MGRSAIWRPNSTPLPRRLRFLAPLHRKCSALRVFLPMTYNCNKYPLASGQGPARGGPSSRIGIPVGRDMQPGNVGKPKRIFRTQGARSIEHQRDEVIVFTSPAGDCRPVKSSVEVVLCTTVGPSA